MANRDERNEYATAKWDAEEVRRQAASEQHRRSSGGSRRRQAKRNRTWPGKWEAYYDNGRAHSGYDVVEWAKRGVALGAGEILLMSVDNEGLQRGMDLELIEAVTRAVSIPVICGGGVGCADDIVDAARAGADAVACAAVLHYNKATVQELKAEIRAAGVEVRV